jgi:hypothetical protein
MAAWNEVLGRFEQPGDPDHQHNDAEAVFGIAKAEGGSNHRERCEPLQVGGSPSDGPKLNRQKSEGRDGANEQPRDLLEEHPDCHAGHAVSSGRR